jgi:hypothetical protein
MRILFRIIIRIAVATLMMVAQNRGQAATTTDPSGTFLTEDGRARVRVERCGSAPERICGYIVWMKEAADAKGHAMTKDESREIVYGMPFDEWRSKYQKEASQDQKAAFEKSRSGH